jgi:DNA-binding IclR family transcriptional regulator
LSYTSDFVCDEVANLTRATHKRPFLIPVLSKALDILELQNKLRPMRLESAYQWTNISKTTVYRIRKTLLIGAAAVGAGFAVRRCPHSGPVRLGHEINNDR